MKLCQSSDIKVIVVTNHIIFQIITLLNESGLLTGLLHRPCRKISEATLGIGVVQHDHGSQVIGYLGEEPVDVDWLEGQAARADVKGLRNVSPDLWDLSSLPEIVETLLLNSIAWWLILHSLRLPVEDLARNVGESVGIGTSSKLPDRCTRSNGTMEFSWVLHSHPSGK